ncbi:M23 family metallopeptidase [Enhydrobacter aerosaccus]|uniref:M23 family metallopeptidase n=1 Tax=Enhydrobacter aerosaccus TaxID=225324 RepID=UPI00148288D5|nr:M23 family metallopeptidase [Enhydrobacter aerosaccus]
MQSYLPFTRAIAVSGVVKDGLDRSTAEAGVPPAVMLEGLKALATTIDLDRDVHDGDRFYVRYAQMFTAAGDPIEVGHILWLELKTAAKGTLALHRFRPASAGQESLWLASGQSTAPPELEMPLASITVTSGFGMRADPVDQPWASRVAIGPIGPAPWGAGQNWRPKVVPAPSPLTSAGKVNAPTPLGLAMGLAPPGSGRLSGFKVGGAPMQLHEGVDLVAAVGTPVYAAGDGIVIGAEPKGRYGNWIEIDHAGKLATVYGHLSAFAAGIKAGSEVKQGDLIGYTGNTGRTTGPHLHFEIRVNGRPTNPIGNAALKHAQLRGPDLVKFRKVVADDLAERAREAKSM